MVVASNNSLRLEIPISKPFAAQIDNHNLKESPTPRGSKLTTSKTRAQKRQYTLTNSISTTNEEDVFPEKMIIAHHSGDHATQVHVAIWMFDDGNIQGGVLS